jgi:hypothetical protein
MGFKFYSLFLLIAITLGLAAAVDILNDQETEVLLSHDTAIVNFLFSPMRNST